MTHFNGKIKLVQPEIGVDISPDNKAATVTFNDASVYLNKNELINHKVISLLLPIEIDDTNVTFKVDIRGFQLLHKSTRGLLVTQIGGKTSTLIFSGSDESNSDEGSDYIKSLDIDLQDIEPQEGAFYPATFFLLLERLSDDNGEAYLTIDSLDFEFVQS